MLAVIFVPRIKYSPGGRYETGRSYSLFLIVERNSETDVKQLGLNFAVAALLGCALSLIPRRWVPRLFIAAGIAGVAGAAITVIVTSSIGKRSAGEFSNRPTPKFDPSKPYEVVTPTPLSRRTERNEPGPKPTAFDPDAYLASRAPKKSFDGLVPRGSPAIAQPAQTGAAATSSPQGNHHQL